MIAANLVQIESKLNLFRVYPSRAHSSVAFLPVFLLLLSYFINNANIFLIAARSRAGLWQQTHIVANWLFC